MAHTDFGRKPDGTPYVVELGANWVTIILPGRLRSRPIRLSVNSRTLFVDLLIMMDPLGAGAGNPSRP